MTPAPGIKAALRCRARPCRQPNTALPLPRPGVAPAPNVKKDRYCRGTRAELKYEAAAGEMFPHLYGELNVDAVARVVELPSEADGSFRLPSALRS